MVAIYLLALLLTASCKWTDRCAIEVNMENERFTVACSLANTLNLEIPRCYLADYVKEF